MTIWKDLLFGPLYASDMCVDGVLASAGGQTVSLRVRDFTSGVAIPDRSQVETVRPVARVRATDLSDNGVTVADLTDGNVTFSGATWRIKATRMVPSPAGEADGEVMLILLNEP